MPDIFSLKTAEWTLNVWSKDITSAQNVLAETRKARGLSESPVTTMIKLMPPLAVVDVDSEFESTLGSLKNDKTGLLVFSEPVFFENKIYEFDFQFVSGLGISAPYVMHRNRSAEDAFHTTRDGMAIRGQINFGNDVGWFKLTLGYSINNKEKKQTISFEVLPLKMDLHTDLDAIQKSIDSTFPLWRFSLASKTEHEFSARRNSHEFFPLLWLAHFEKLREKLLKDVNVILNSPHNKLLSHTRILPADKLKNKLPNRLEEKVKDCVDKGELHKRFSITTKKLNIDTMENRFIKMVLTECSRILARFIRSARLGNEQPEKQILSERFFETLESWQHSVNVLLYRPLFKEIGEFTHFNKESLVLQQKTGYAGVYKTWQQLKLYLDVFGDNASLSLKSVAELYEVWCFLEVRNILIDIGFEELNSIDTRYKKSGLEVRLVDGKFGAFEFFRKDKIRIRLAHEPLFSRFKEPITNQIFSWTVNQKPDIFLEATFANGERIHWIFDAKYQIEKNPYMAFKEEHGTKDLVPMDAINQMHRYRDALIHVDGLYGNEVIKSRPVFGAFALYPGFVDADKDNPYQMSIDSIAIGAFALLPNRPNIWIKQFFEKTFGVINKNVAYPISPANADIHYIQEAARIPYSGMRTQRYNDLTLVASIENTAGRDPEYLQRFLSGSATAYHTQLLATNRQGIHKNIVREIRYCALAVPVNEGQPKIIQYIYPVLNVQETPRADIDENITGKADPSNKNIYWVLILGKARLLNSPVLKPDSEHFELKLTHLDLVEQGIEWNALPSLYEFNSDVYSALSESPS